MTLTILRMTASPSCELDLNMKHCLIDRLRCRIDPLSDGPVAKGFAVRSRRWRFPPAGREGAVPHGNAPPAPARSAFFADAQMILVAKTYGTRMGHLLVSLRVIF